LGGVVVSDGADSVVDQAALDARKATRGLLAGETYYGDWKRMCEADLAHACVVDQHCGRQCIAADVLVYKVRAVEAMSQPTDALSDQALGRLYEFWRANRSTVPIVFGFSTPEPAVTSLVASDRSEKIRSSELRPRDIAEIKLAVGTLPE